LKLDTLDIFVVDLTLDRLPLDEAFAIAAGVSEGVLGPTSEAPKTLS
jgi:hypothetical protein